MMARRHDFLLLGLCVLSSCALPTLEPESVAPIWLHISADEIRVDNELVELIELERAILDHAIAHNPGMTEETALQEVPVYVRSYPGVSIERVQQVLPVLTRRFRKVLIVGEDRRG